MLRYIVMRRIHLASGIVALLCISWLATGAVAFEEARPGIVQLVLPRQPAAQEAVWVRITVGALARGARLRVSTSDGTLIGSVASFGARRGQESASYDIPIPPSAVVDGRVQLRLEVLEAGAPARAPAAGEIEDVALLYIPVTN